MTTPAVLGSVDVTYLEDNALSGNGRLYLPEAVESSVHLAQEDLANNRPITVFATHSDGLADDASKMAGRVTRVWREGSRALARVDLFATEVGRNMAAVLKGGGVRTCSLRSTDFATGAPREVNGKMVETMQRVRLAGIDFTMIPGITTAGLTAMALESTPGAARLLETMTVGVHDRDLPLLEAGVVKRREADGLHPASDYAFVPDPDKVSTWKLRIDTPRFVAGSAASFSPGGFRGRRVQIPPAMVAKVKAKVRAAWRKFYPDKTASEMPASIKEALALEAISVAIPDWDPCQHCMDGDNDACTCPGCTNGGDCWCSAVLDDADQRGDTPVEETMTAEEIQTLIETGVARALASHHLEATHSHVHEHEGMDGDLYSHEHSHRHEGTADHEDPAAHMHSHGVTYEQLIHVAPRKLIEALTVALREQTSTIAESGRTHSAATITTLKAMRTAAHSGVCEAVDKLLGDQAPQATEGVATLQATLTESLSAQKTLTEQNAELTAKLTEAQSQIAALTTRATTLTDVLGKEWRTQRKVPVEALLSGGDGTQEISDKDALHLYSHALASKMGANR